jgi:hypothetical protein
MVFAAIFHAILRPELFVFILAFGGFLWLAYFLIDIWVDGAIMRWQQRSGC